MRQSCQSDACHKKIAVVWDNAGWHRSKDLRRLFAEGQALENITTIQLLPYAPEHNPVEHVWNHAKGAIANFQREEPALTFSAFEDYVRGSDFQCRSGRTAWCSAGAARPPPCSQAIWHSPQRLSEENPDLQSLDYRRPW